MISEEKSVIVPFAAENISIRDIAARVKRPKSAVQEAIKAAKATKEAGRSGAKPKITHTQNRAIIRSVSRGVRTAREVRDTYNCNVNVLCIQQILRNAPHLKYKKC